ncbi:MAG TPA: heme exporter protein CcmB, partial [Fimbriimonadaceae bacterium]|nr:heme exporter protein CcmB [Fimbriimonadaceae bacterium]
MSSNWAAEIGAVFRKELLSESRSRSGFLTAMLFSIVAVVAVSFAGYGQVLSGSMGAGLFWVVMLFSSVVSLPRAFLAEEEQGTADMLKLLARPHAIFWGKALFNLVQMILTGLMLSVLFLVLSGLEVRIGLLYAAGLVAGSTALAGAVTLCGALVAQAANRAALVGAIALPLLLPLVALGVGTTRVALGEGLAAGGWQSAVGLVSYAVAVLA